MEETIFVAWMHERGIPVITRSLLVVLCLTLVMSSCQAVGVPVTQETEATTLTAIPSPTTTPSPTPEPLKDIQLLFTSSKQRRRNIRVKEIVEKLKKDKRKEL